jgi:uncharacterized protein (TIGR02118 family)
MRQMVCWSVIVPLALAACGKSEAPAAKADSSAMKPESTAAAAPAAPAPAGPQAIVTVIYNQPTSPVAFEKYYAEKHLPLVTSLQSEIGFTRAELTRFTATLDGKKPTFYRQAELYFNSMDDAKKGMATDGFKKVGADLKNFATGGLIGLVGEQQ